VSLADGASVSLADSASVLLADSACASLVDSACVALADSTCMAFMHWLVVLAGVVAGLSLAGGDSFERLSHWLVAIKADLCYRLMVTVVVCGNSLVVGCESS
jgi:hypothetical protein